MEKVYPPAPVFDLSDCTAPLVPVQKGPEWWESLSDAERAALFMAELQAFSDAGVLE